MTTMESTHEYKFRIDAFTPETILMSRLAEYMAALAPLLGEKERVHFVRLEEGSTVLVQEIESESLPKVRSRLQTIDAAEGEGPEEALRAFKAIDRRLAQDNAVGCFYEESGAEVIHFPGCEAPKPLTFWAFIQQGSLDGTLIKVGVKDKTVPVQKMDGTVVHICNANREIARVLAPHPFGPTLRVHGQGRWERDAEGVWILRSFNIAEHEVLDDTSLSDVVDRLRQVSSNGWKEVEGPLRRIAAPSPRTE